MKAMLFEMLVTSSVLIAAIFGLRRLTMGKISMRLRYGLWLLAAVRLLMPVSLGTSPVSVMNFFPGAFQEDAFQGGIVQEFDGAESERQKDDTAFGAQGKNNGTEPVFAMQNPAQEINGPGNNIAPVMNETSGVEKDSADTTGVKVAENSFHNINVTLNIVAGVWILGVLAVGGYLFFQRFRFARYLRRNRKRVDGKEIPVFIGEKLEKRRMRVYRVKGLPSPCLVGRCIYIGEQMPGGEQGLIHVLAHEYCHRAHGDGFWAFLRCTLAALYWFDPLVWAAAFAARRDSDLACDETVVRLLGEEERFAYGKTLLALLQKGGGTACPGMPLLFSGSERSVRERIVSLTEKKKAEAVVFVAVLSMVLLVCGCAFTGAQPDGAAISGEENGQGTGVQEDGENEAGEQETGLSGDHNEDGSSEMERLQVFENELNKEFAQIQAEYEALDAAKQAAFEEVLNYGGVMEGKDDSELSLNRDVDMQHFYEYGEGKREDAPEEGWYLLCRNEEETIAFYGLFTKDFGCRGVKSLIGDDVNTFDLVWYPTVSNGVSANIRVLEQAQDGLPRRFVWKYMEEESRDTEISRLAGGYRYDTGMVDLQVLSEEDYLSWADWHLTYQIDEERQQVQVFYDEDGSGSVGVLDISAYAGLPIEEVRVAPGTVGFDLDGGAFEGEEMALHLCVGLKLAGYDDIFTYGLSPIAIQVLYNEDGGGFRLGRPKVDEKYSIQNPEQEKKLEEIRNGATEDNALAEPLVFPGAHNDVAIIFANPCPDYERISDPYGERIHPVTGEKRLHNGVDMAAPLGADVLAAANGTVYRTGFDAENGNYVVLWHGDSGQMTYYTHCGDILVSEGDHAAAGDKIATVGQTGRATGPHLHFAVSGDGEWQEPVWGGEK